METFEEWFDKYLHPDSECESTAIKAAWNHQQKKIDIAASALNKYRLIPIYNNESLEYQKPGGPMIFTKEYLALAALDQLGCES